MVNVQRRVVSVASGHPPQSVFGKFLLYINAFLRKKLSLKKNLRKMCASCVVLILLCVVSVLSHVACIRSREVQKIELFQDFIQK